MSAKQPLDWNCKCAVVTDIAIQITIKEINRHDGYTNTVQARMVNVELKTYFKSAGAKWHCYECYSTLG